MGKIGPKTENHPSIGELCRVCNRPFKEGEFTTLVSLGPDSEEGRSRRDLGRPYNSVAIEIHWQCSEKREVEKK